MNDILLHPVDWYNLHGIFKDIFKREKEGICHLRSDTEVSYLDPSDLQSSLNQTTYKIQAAGQIAVLRNNPHGIASGIFISKFTLLSIIQFKGDYRAAESWVMYKLMDLDIPYIRVACDWFKVIYKKNRHGAKVRHLKKWKKDELSDDHSKKILKLVPKYDDFCIVPDNITYKSVHDNLYNLYSEFPHTPHTTPVAISDIPHSLSLVRHIFGAQYAIGLKYIKLMYELPQQPLHVPVLVSEKRETGKTTFLNWIQMIFGPNFVNVNPGNITSDFNSVYANKNIIAIDETMIEKSMGAEKIKSIVTAQTIIVNPKHTQEYELEFFGKIIMCTNKERDFMRIDSEENRFWVLKIPPISSKKNVNILKDLFSEIPKFLRYLLDLPPVDTSQSRFGLPHEEIYTESLKDVQEESKSGLRKDIEIKVEDYFMNNKVDEFYATPIDLHKIWFAHDKAASLNYIRKVLKIEMKLQPLPPQQYSPFNDPIISKMGRPFKFERKSFCDYIYKLENAVNVDL